MKNDLIRQEYIENKKIMRSGSIVAATDFTWFPFFFLFLVFFLVLIYFLIFLDYTRRINVYGELTTFPHSINIFTPQQGFVTRKYVDVGEFVEKGQKLYKIDVSKVTYTGKVSSITRTEIENQIQHLEDMVIKLEVNKETTKINLVNQVNHHKTAAEQTKKLLEIASEGVEFAKENMNAYNDYKNRGLVTKDQFIVQKNSFYQLQNSFQSLYSQYIQETLTISVLESDILTRAADFDNQISQYKLQRNDLHRQLIESDASDSLIINAPRDGKIESLSVTEGQMVSAGDSLIQIAPQQDITYKLIIWVPNTSIPYINIGDPIRIRYDAFPYEKFGQFLGSIESISRVPASIQEMSLYSSSPVHKPMDTSSFYKVTVALQQDSVKYLDEDLSINDGMRAKATIFLEKRPLYQWIFSPLYNMKNSLVG